MKCLLAFLSDGLLRRHLREAALRDGSIYTINEHNHIFAAWAAGSAASRGSFKIQHAHEWLEKCFTANCCDPALLPSPSEIDREHRRWRTKIIKASRARGEITHGRAAKLINCYLKARFVCAGHHMHPHVQALHPPIDRLLLRTLSRKKVPGLRGIFSSTGGWSNFSSDQYEEVISRIRDHLKGAPMWAIEQDWRGYQ